MAVQPVRIKAKARPAAKHRPFVVVVAMRFPSLTRMVFDLVFRLPQGRLRRTIAEWGMREIAMGSLTRRDFEALKVPLSLDFQVIPAPELAGVVMGDRGELRGREAGMHYYETFLEVWREFAFVLKEIVDLGDGRVLLLNHMHGTGGRSGLEIVEDEAELLEYRDGVHVRLQQWRSWREALAAVGVPE